MNDADQSLPYVKPEYPNRDREVGHKHVDFLVEGVMVEIKARVQIEDMDVIQTLSY